MTAPPPHARHRTEGAVSAISSPTVPCPAMITGESYGGTTTAPVSRAMRSPAARRSGVVVPASTTVPPYRSTPARLAALTVVGMTAVHGTPNMRAAYATACAWLPMRDNDTTARSLHQAAKGRSTPRETERAVPAAFPASPKPSGNGSEKYPRQRGCEKHPCNTRAAHANRQRYHRRSPACHQSNSASRRFVVTYPSTPTNSHTNGCLGNHAHGGHFVCHERHQLDALCSTTRPRIHSLGANGTPCESCGSAHLPATSDNEMTSPCVPFD